MYQSASIAGVLPGFDRVGLGPAVSSKTAPSWARPGQAARWAAETPEVVVTPFVSGPELTDSDKPTEETPEEFCFTHPGSDLRLSCRFLSAFVLQKPHDVQAEFQEKGASWAAVLEREFGCKFSSDYYNYEQYAFFLQVK